MKNDAAFPVQKDVDPNGIVVRWSEIGVTKQEYFAALALQGLCISSIAHLSPEALADRAVACADALLKRLES